jgi:predicted DNA-binding helix-hairpin-helix protein
MKRAQYFITCKGKILDGLKLQPDSILRGLIASERAALPGVELEQMSLFDRVG